MLGDMDVELLNRDGKDIAQILIPTAARAGARWQVSQMLPCRRSDSTRGRSCWPAWQQTT